MLTELLRTIVATAIPKISDEFNGLDKFGSYGAAYFMTLGAFQLTCKSCFGPGRFSQSN